MEAPKRAKIIDVTIDEENCLMRTTYEDLDTGEIFHSSQRIYPEVRPSRKKRLRSARRRGRA